MFSRYYDRTFVRVITMTIALLGAVVLSTSASRAQQYTAQEIVDSGHKFFGETSGGFRRLIQIVFGLSIAFAASSFFLSFFSFGGGALIA